jgi:hypothetical protein
MRDGSKNYWKVTERRKKGGLFFILKSGTKLKYIKATGSSQVGSEIELCSVSIHCQESDQITETDRIEQ